MRLIAGGRASRARALLGGGAAALALAACGNDNDPGPGGVTVGEARALDEAAEMLEQQRPASPAASQTPDEADPAAPQGEGA